MWQGNQNLQETIMTRRQNSWSKMAYDFMSDIMGAIIPGVLFIMALLLNVALPVIVLSTLTVTDVVPLFSLGNFLLLLIIAYAIGNIFYRAEINIPDKISINRNLREHSREVLFAAKRPIEIYKHDDNVERRIDLLKMREDNPTRAKQIVFLKETLCKLAPLTPEEESELLKLFAYVKLEINKNDSKKQVMDVIDLMNDCLDLAFYDNLWQVQEKLEGKDQEKEELLPPLRLFFEEIKHIDFCDNFNEFRYVANFVKCDFLSDDIEQILQNYYEHVLLESGFKKEYLKDYKKALRISRCKKHILTVKERLILYTVIRKMQNDEGTSHPSAGGFPYINFENYLLKRGFHTLAESVIWNNREGRTKNQVNRYKIKLNLFAPDSCTLINKNESHIRMASSSWYAGKSLLKINRLISLVVFLCVIPIHMLGGHNIYTAIFALLLLGALFGIADERGKTIIDISSFLLLLAAFIILSPGIVNHCNCIDRFHLLLPTIPYFVNILIRKMMEKIEDHIHYQRLREIYFTMYTYAQCKRKMDYIEASYNTPKKGE